MGFPNAFVRIRSLPAPQLTGNWTFLVKIEDQICMVIHWNNQDMLKDTLECRMSIIEEFIYVYVCIYTYLYIIHKIICAVQDICILDLTGVTF